MIKQKVNIDVETIYSYYEHEEIEPNVSLLYDNIKQSHIPVVVHGRDLIRLSKGF